MGGVSYPLIFFYRIWTACFGIRAGWVVVCERIDRYYPVLSQHNQTALDLLAHPGDRLQHGAARIGVLRQMKPNSRAFAAALTRSSTPSLP